MLFLRSFNKIFKKPYHINRRIQFFQHNHFLLLLFENVPQETMFFRITYSNPNINSPLRDIVINFSAPFLKPHYIYALSYALCYALSYALCYALSYALTQYSGHSMDCLEQTIVWFVTISLAGYPPAYRLTVSFFLKIS